MMGTTLAHYEIQGKLGSGGMGDVYRARDTKLKRDVAIKVLPETLAGDRERMARFQREAEALAALNHPKDISYDISPDGEHFVAVQAKNMTESRRQSTLHFVIHFDEELRRRLGLPR